MDETDGGMTNYCDNKYSSERDVFKRVDRMQWGGGSAVAATCLPTQSARSLISMRTKQKKLTAYY